MSLDLPLPLAYLILTVGAHAALPPLGTFIYAVGIVWARA